MAKLSELVAGMADALKLDARSVALCARYLREEGLITQKGRGPSAADMTPRDAVNLLFGLMAAPEIKDAAQCVKRLRAAPFSEGTGTDVEQGLPDIPFLWRDGKKGARPGESFPLPFGEVMDGMLAEDLMIPYPEVKKLIPILNCHLTVHRPGSAADVAFGDGSRFWSLLYAHPPKEPTKPQLKRLAATGLEGGMGIGSYTTIGAVELYLIADILSPTKEGAQE